MTDSAMIKIRRASTLIQELISLLKHKRAFIYALETNTIIGQRATFAKRNEDVIIEIATICGDIIHNVRSSLDHAYWDIVSPFPASEKERRSLQFPFSEEEEGLEKAVKKRLADRVSQAFFKAIIDLKPHGGQNGNEDLFLIHRLDIFDKHKLLIPTGNFVSISSNDLISQVPDFPRGMVNFGFGQNHRDVVWRVPPMSQTQRRAAKVPESGILVKDLNIPVEIVFQGTEVGALRPVIPALRQLCDAATTAINTIRKVQQ